ncbi:MAG: prepilin-type N-terminal cleavage/methylation domain-containing protein [gamma proteobacterium symbiont of Taylorina sp.]|nr:prepilin-type N-terminal cleavage/methylation domain-containing protein [gamma proteobacterium symbiont of Taylorina sp.]
MSRIRKNPGFTLLEVMVSITLTALVLGNLFALQSQSKQLSFKAQTNLARTINQRFYLNAAWISNHELDTYMDELSELEYTVDNKQTLIKPEKQSKALKYSLESFDIINAQKEVILSSVRMKKSIVNRQ